MAEKDIVASITIDDDEAELDVTTEKLMKQLLQQLKENGVESEKVKWIPCG
ncbi:hypothetical protein MUP77_01290 [Candidatus Bathyarchaeota archaeon]|nr:hypothetical protein [Candidatus Bathyarchaeota archaeon]